MSEATIILSNMRGGCATVGGTVHTLFRLNNRRTFVGDAKTDAGKSGARDGAADDLFRDEAIA
jgi:hypothetical protein